MTRRCLVFLSLGVASCCSQQAPLQSQNSAVVHETATHPPGPQSHIAHAPTRAALQQSGIKPELIRCNTDVRWIPNLKKFSQQAAREIVPGDPAAQSRAEGVIIGYLVRAVFQEVQPLNFGVVRLRGLSYRDERGRTRPLLVFRSGMTFAPQKKDACLNTVIKHGGVRHVINLYDGHFPLYDLVAEEKRVALELGATYHDARSSGKPWRPMIKKPDSYRTNLPKAMSRVARLIRDQILAPGGKPPRGNVHLHCGGGMHRTGMIFGVLRRCINNDPTSVIVEEYERHVAIHACRRGKRCGHEPLNLRFIQDFDCALLNQKSKP